MSGVIKLLLSNEVKLTNEDPVIGDSHRRLGTEKVEHVDRVYPLKGRSCSG
jgi:hypothetical protein